MASALEHTMAAELDSPEPAHAAERPQTLLLLQGSGAGQMRPRQGQQLGCTSICLFRACTARGLSNNVLAATGAALLPVTPSPPAWAELLEVTALSLAGATDTECMRAMPAPYAT